MSDGPANWEHDRAVNARRAREREKRIQDVIEEARKLAARYGDYAKDLKRALLDFDLHEQRNV